MSQRGDAPLPRLVKLDQLLLLSGFGRHRFHDRVETIVMANLSMAPASGPESGRLAPRMHGSVPTFACSQIFGTIWDSSARIHGLLLRAGHGLDGFGARNRGPRLIPRLHRDLTGQWRKKSTYAESSSMRLCTAV